MRCEQRRNVNATEPRQRCHVQFIHPNPDYYRVYSVYTGSDIRIMLPYPQVGRAASPVPSQGRLAIKPGPQKFSFEHPATPAQCSTFLSTPP